MNYEVTFVSEPYRLASQALVAELKEAMTRELAADTAPEKVEEEVRAKYKERAKTELKLPCYTEIVDHIDHVVSVMGIDHVGLGSDFDGATMPQGMEDCAKAPWTTDELVKRGYSDSDIKKILGENTLRVMAQVIGE